MITTIRRRPFDRRLTATLAAATLIAWATGFEIPIASALPFANCAQAQAAGAAPITVSQPGYSFELDSDGDGLACETDAIQSSDTVGTLVQVVIHKSYSAVSDSCVGVGQLAPIQPGSQVILSPGSFQGAMPEVGRTDFTHADLRDGLCFVTYRAANAPLMPTFGLQFVAPDGGTSGVYGPTKSQPISVAGQPEIRQAVRVDMEFAS